MDTISREQRSKVMASIRSKNTRPEMIVRRFLYANGFRYRIHVKSLPGSPDIVIPSLNACIFVNGCFWHAHSGCEMFRMPKSHQDYWQPKINANVIRDKRAHIELRELGWHVVDVWECQLKRKVREMNLRGLLRTLNYLVLENHKAHIYQYDDDDFDNTMAAEEYD